MPAARPVPLTVHAVTCSLLVLATLAPREPSVHALHPTLEYATALAGERELTPAELCVAFDTSDPDAAVEALYAATADALEGL